MKLKKKKTAPKKPLPKVETTLSQLANGNIKLFHSQSLKRNYNYNSAESVYGIEVEVAPKDAEQAVRLMETAVQKLLLPKSEKQLEYLVRNST